MELTSLHVLHESDTYRIWRGENKALGHRFTVKELVPSARLRPVYSEWIQKETDYLGKFAHQRLLKLINADSTDQVLYEDTQCTLEQLIQRHGPLTNELTARVLTQCLEALTWLHQRGQSHGMLCTRNTFVDPTGNVKLGDFTGFRFEKEEPVISVYPKKRFQAPEIIDSDLGKCGPESDLYSLGFLALELLAGDKLPRLLGIELEKNDPQAWMRWHIDMHRLLGDWPSVIPHVNKALAGFIDGLVLKDPRSRAFRNPADALKRLGQLNLEANRALPMFNAEAHTVPKSDGVFVPPSRRLGPVLLLQPRGNNPQLKAITVDSGTPLVVNARPEGTGQGGLKRLSLLSCQVRDWYLYDLSGTGATKRNCQKVSMVGPQRVKKGDELQFGDDRYLVDLILQGTGTIRGFDLLKRIHAGSGGDLYEARWYLRSLKTRDVALRMLAQDFAIDPEQVRRFLRAIPAAGRIRHPNIVPIFKAGRCRRVSESNWYVASELMCGGSLRDRLKGRKKGLPLSRVQKIGREISAALQAARQHGLLHRNINSSCILFSELGTAKLGDFSLARGEVVETILDITRGKLLPGDYHYQSPEMLLAEPNIDCTSDLFSLSVCLFEAILGKLPFPVSGSLAETINTLCQFQWPSLREFRRDVPSQWDVFFQAVLNRDRSRRLQSPEDWRKSLESLPLS